MFFKKKVRVYGKTHFYKQGEIIYIKYEFPAHIYPFTVCVCFIFLTYDIHTHSYFLNYHTPLPRVPPAFMNFWKYEVGL